ncbi:acyltransferase [Clostridium saccharoperbutylacetonicum]|uniref:acyltransferase n=1 Tax=Clostridium saccharoperbutylacetonicum TaxID=36745 RepID=UPI000983BFC6|nr:acyltransferase [Clostridium saccharoperbutylacetonicum]AQR96988.1 maltose O-acetyltransferase [Clostridium saccharoperbutylacetonicum]NSB32867.1 acetyltransferase-like isoleucine patch superfamily enzyme [Clostridium saccharoperbutylacetonicum]
MKSFFENINENNIENLKKYIQDREIVIWGFGEFGRNIHDVLLKNNLSIFMFIDSNREKTQFEYKGIKIGLPNILVENKKKFYVIIAAEYYEDIETFLISNNYADIKDYLYILHKPIKVEKCENYTDVYGNKIDGILNNLIVNFTGWNSRITIKKNCIFGGKSEIFSDNGGSITIEDNCIFGEATKIFSSNYGSIIIKKNSIYGENTYIRCNSSNVIIGENGTFGECLLIDVSYNGEVYIGDNCMLSRYVSIIDNDGHPIFNIHTGQQINIKDSIFIGNHIWIGIKSSILSRSKIGDGSIIGANSVVKNIFPNNCIIAGVPAKVVRKDIAWDRVITDPSLIKDRRYWNITEDLILPCYNVKNR